MKRLGWVALALLVTAGLVLGGYLLFYRGSPDDSRPTAVARITDEPFAAGAGSSATGSVARILLLHTNDFHGAVEPEGQGGERESGGLVNLVSLIDQVRAQDSGDVLLLDAGDTFQGTYVSNSTQGQVVMAAMNVAGYDAWVLGNHEFDWGQEPLCARIAEAQFPVLAANIHRTATGKVWESVEPYAIIEVGQARVGVLGLAYPDTPVITKAENVAGLDFRGAEETVRRYLSELESKSDLVVVLSHLGYDGDRALATAVEGIDVIVGGHSHVFLERPDVVKGTIIVQAGAKGQVLGRLELTLDLKTGEVLDYSRSGTLLRVTNDVPTANQEVQALVDAALDQAIETMRQPIGELARALEPRRSGESALGNLVTDAMLVADLSDGRVPDIAMHNSGGIRAGLPKGTINYGQLYAVLPFDNQLMALDLTGAQVLRILEQSLLESPGAMQVAGMSFRFDMSRPKGARVLEAAVGGEPLDPGRAYRVVTIDYLAGGGDGQETFLEGTNPTYGDTEVWAVAEYIRANSPVNPQIEGRITRR